MTACHECTRERALRPDDARDAIVSAGLRGCCFGLQAALTADRRYSSEQKRNDVCDALSRLSSSERPAVDLAITLASPGAGGAPPALEFTDAADEIHNSSSADARADARLVEIVPWQQ
jgi:hypothetical protein